MNIRAEASTDSEILGLAENGERLALLVEDPQNGWYQIQYEGETAYVSSDYAEVIEVTVEEYNRLRSGETAGDATSTPAPSSASSESFSCPEVSGKYFRRECPALQVKKGQCRAMNIMIVGGGLLGRKTAESLDELGHDVVLIDASAENIAQLSPDFSGVTAVGFPMDIKSLRAAGIEGCDAVAVATPDDNLNITVGQIAKNFFGIPKVIARISDPYRENIFERFGLQTVCPTNMATSWSQPLPARGRAGQVSFGSTTVSLEVVPVERRYFNTIHGQRGASARRRPVRCHQG